MVHDERSLTASNPASRSPLIWRYFVSQKMGEDASLSDDEHVVRTVMQTNSRVRNSPLNEYGLLREAILRRSVSTSCSTNSTLPMPGRLMAVSYQHPAWWGAHPFSLLDERGAQRRDLLFRHQSLAPEMYGYACTLQTDTEAIAYAADLLLRRQRIPMEIAKILALPI